MQSLKQLYKIGRGPSSSHTMGPEKACLMFKERYGSADAFRAELFGSLALTGKGHGTDRIIKETLFPVPTDVIFNKNGENLPHPNTFRLCALKNGRVIGESEIYSVGGGEIAVKGETLSEYEDVYSFNTFSEISAYCKKRGIRIYDYVRETEGEEIFSYLSDIWAQMQSTVNEGLGKTGILPGGLNVERKANKLYRSNRIDETPEIRENRMVCAYAFAASEENASGGRIVTAPTCGACGVLPAVLFYNRRKRAFSDEQIICALATAGMIGLLVKTNASISGAECGCQAEIGTACAMAAAALAELCSMDLDRIEYASEIAIEHHLGLTCDPICGLVQIPCIERNAVAAMRAVNAVSLADFLTNSRKISFDLIVKTMLETGRDLNSKYRETSAGGMAKLYTS